MARFVLAIALAGLLVPAGAQSGAMPSDDEFSLLGIQKPSAMLSGMGMPMMNLGTLMDEMENDLKNVGEGQGPSEAGAPVGVMRVMKLPPVLSGLMGLSPEPKQSHPSAVKLHVGFPMFGSSLSRPLQELRSLASGCVPCGHAQAVQSHMRSVQVFAGPNGERVETVTETGPDGEEHTTRTVTNGDQGSGMDDLMDAIMSPLMGGMPDSLERIADEIRPDAQPTKIAAPAANTDVSEEDAKAAVKAALPAEGLELDSSEKRQELAASIAQKLGLSPDSVKVTSKDEGEDADVGADDDADVGADEVADADQDADEDDSAESALPDAEDDSEDDESDSEMAEDDDADQDADAVDDSDSSEMPEDGEMDDETDTGDDAEDADELGKEFEQEEEERKTVLGEEEQTQRRVEHAAQAASDKAAKEMQVADRLRQMEDKIKGVLA